MTKWENRAGAGLLTAFLVFSLITGAFSVLNVFDDKSYVVASAVSEQCVLTMMSVVGYLTYYLAYRNTKRVCGLQAAMGKGLSHLSYDSSFQDQPVRKA